MARERLPSWKLSLLTGTAALYLRFAMRTSRIWIDGAYNEDLARQGGKPIIYAFWHGGLLVPVYTHRNRDIHVLSSMSSDGDLIAGFIHRFGFGVVRGSTSRGGVRALIGMKRVVAQGFDTAFTPDGPRGPRFFVQGGAIALAKLTGAALVPAGFALSRCFVFHKSWDRFRVPKPLSRVAVALQPPMGVAEDADEALACDELARRIHAADARAQEMIAGWRDRARGA